MYLQQIIQSIAVGVPLRFSIQADYFRLILAADPVDIRFYNQGREVGNAVQMDTGFYVKGEPFEAVEITSATAQTLKLMLMQGDGGYERFNVDITSALSTLTINQANTVTETAPKTVGVAAVVAVAANAARKGVRFTNAGTATIYIGGAGVTVANSAISIAAGATWLEDDAAPAAWYAISGTAAQTLKIQELIA